MARTEHKTYTYSCDLCGCERDEDDLADLYGKPETGLNGRSQYPRADVCRECRARPIGDLLDYFEHTRRPALLPTITVRTEPARQAGIRVRRGSDDASMSG